MTNQFLINSCQSLVSLTRLVPFLNNKQTNYKLSSYRAVYKRFNYNFAKWTESESESSKLHCADSSGSNWFRYRSACVSDGRATSSDFVYEASLFVNHTLHFDSRRKLSRWRCACARRRGKWEFPIEANSWLLNASPKFQNALGVFTRTASHKKLRISVSVSREPSARTELG